MTGAERALRLASRLAVALWIGLYLAWSAAPAPEAPESRTAHIEPRPEAPPEPEPAPPPDPAPAEASPPISVGSDEIARGDALLDAGGRFPALTCSYDDFRSFRDYARAMAALGARFVVVRERRIVGSVDPESGALGDAAVGAGYSPRARDYTGEPGLSELARAAKDRFGRGAVVMMLVPREMDAGLFGGIARTLSERGDRHDAYREIRGRYERAPRGGVHLRVDAGIRKDGTPVGMDLLFDLTQIAREADAARGPRA